MIGLVTAVVLWSALLGWTAAPTAAVTDGAPADQREQTVDRLTVTATPRTVAAGVDDAVTIDGQTPDGFDVRLYLVGPRGTFLDADGRAEAMTTAAVSSNAFSEAFRAFARRGTYTLVAVNPGSDGTFQTDAFLGRGSLPSGLTQQQAVDVVRSEYAGDEVVELSIDARTPSLEIDTIAEGGIAAYGADVTVSGTSNRGDGTSVTVELLDGSNRLLTTTVADVDGVTGEWSTDLGTAEIEPGSYTVVASTDASRASALLVVAMNGTTTPAETPIETPTGDESASETTGDGDPVAAANETLDNGTGAAPENATNTTTGGKNGTTNGTANETADGGDGSTSSSLPGFGVGAVVAALVVVGLAARRRVAR